MPNPIFGGRQAPLTHAPSPAALALAMAEAGLTCFPTLGKKPVVKWTQYQTKAPTPKQVQNWWQWQPSANVGIPTGTLNGLTVIDVDGCGHAPETLPHLLQLFGPTPLVVATPGKGGGYQLYYQHGGERNNTAWELEGFNGDIRGEGGFVMAPGSLHPDTQTHYHTGGDVGWFLSTLRGLPRPKQIPAKQALQRGQLPTEGGRNHWLFQEALKLAVNSPSADSLATEVEKLNASLPSPLPQPEASRVASNAWGYKAKGTLMVGREPSALMVESEVMKLHADEFHFLAWLRMKSGYRQDEFAIGQNAMSKQFRYCHKKVARLIKALITTGYLVQTHKGGKAEGDYSRYRWAKSP